MANRRDIKRRIVSVINTQKITKAMKLVAAAKFARASHAVNSARPYSKAFGEMVLKLVGASHSVDLESDLLRLTEEKKILCVVIATDRGLCGGLNTNLLRAAKNWLIEKRKENVQCVFFPWGRKAISWAKKQGEGIHASKEKVLEKPSYESVLNYTKELKDLFSKGEFDAVYLINNCYINALTQTPQAKKLFPIDPNGVKANESESAKVADILVEPPINEMLDRLLTRKVAIDIFQAILEGAASEHGSRMTAMDNATRNAGEVRKKLVLKYNRVRQAAITKELIEIISGAEAL